MKGFVTALVFVVATSVGAFAQNLPLPSKWQNQRNSTMELKLGKSPAAVNFTDLYCNRAEGFGCQCGNNVNRYKITGQANGSSVTFTVVWNNGIQNCHCMNWIGVWRIDVDELDSVQTRTAADIRHRHLLADTVDRRRLNRDQA